jgi:uncharacterized RDD family membrane protein YckC
MSNFGSDFPAGAGYQNNPYQPIGIGYGVPQPSTGPETAQLASLLQRFLGALLDSLFAMFCGVPGFVLMIIGMVVMEQQQRENPGDSPDFPLLMLLGMLLIAIGSLVMLAVQIWLLATRSQTLGKFVMKTQVVDFETGQPADFVHCAILRILINSLIGSIPCVGGIYSLVDIFYIFREDRRCIHDLIASTTVIDISNR